jgi:hypothetical protein
VCRVTPGMTLKWSLRQSRELIPVEQVLHHRELDAVGQSTA